MRYSQLISLTLCICVAGQAYAAAPTTETQAQTPVNQQDQSNLNKDGIYIYCPYVIDMSKKGLFWGAPGGWRSYAQSFVKEIETFVGAQWAGINVGKMLCIYKGKDELTFPVILQNDTLTLMPKREKLPDNTKFNHWGKYENGYVNCNSVEVKDCPFVKKSDKLDIEKVYEELDFFKNKEKMKTSP